MFNAREFKPAFNFIKRFIKFGFPNGIHLFFDLFIFTFSTLLIIDSLGILELSASNITMSIYSLFYTPVASYEVTTSIIVKNYLGKNKVSIAQTSVKTALHMVRVYIITIVFLYIYTKHAYISFLKGLRSLVIKQVKPTIIILLKFIAVLHFSNRQVLYFLWQ